MSHRIHLRTIRIASAFIEACIRERYTWKGFVSDCTAGLTVGVIAIPLAMALAVASGAPPQNGLYTAVVGGFIIALLGGSRYSISGPTAAFVILLYPITQQFGLGGLFLATFFSGIFLLLMGLLRLGRLIEYIPQSVVLGFTGGIAVVIATLQLNDFLGLNIEALPESYVQKLILLSQSFLNTRWEDACVGGSTLLILIFWKRLKLSIPAHLPALAVGLGLAWLMGQFGYSVDTIASRFTYVLPGGRIGEGVPAVLPHFIAPWLSQTPQGASLFSFDVMQALLPAAFAIATLGAIESLLCAVVLDGMTGRRHYSNVELMAQGVGNIIGPFFGCIPATAALARSAANCRAGAHSPVAAMVHSGVVLAGFLLLAPLLGLLPMASLAALLLMIAWNMSEAHKALALLKKAPRSDVIVFLTCFFLTVFLGMVIAIATGVLLAAVLFVRDIAKITEIREIDEALLPGSQGLPKGWNAYCIDGPLFFAAADRVFSKLILLTEGKSGVIFDLSRVSFIDAGGIAAFASFLDLCAERKQELFICGIALQPMKMLLRAKVSLRGESRHYASSLSDVWEQIHARQMLSS